MELYVLVNLISVCVVNGFFTFAGIFLNSKLIISLWKSPELRKGNCHFMIFMLSCVDLAVIIVAHPTLILLSIAWILEENTVCLIGMYLRNLHLILQGLEFGVLLSMNMDRYLAIAHPFFYQAKITKRRILQFMIVVQLIFVLPVVYTVFLVHLRAYIQPQIFNMQTKVILIYTATSVALLLCTMIFMNYKMFMIARQKKQAIRESSMLKRNSTCLWVIGCFLICTIPLIVYCLLFVSSLGFMRDKNVQKTFNFWQSTIGTMNCTFNCVILFWRNRSLWQRKGNQ